jgi:hypothetical protein
MQRSIITTTLAILAVLGGAWYSSDASDVRIELSNPVPGFNSMGPFEATGGAVDDGVICAAGEGSMMAVEDTADGGVLAEYEFRCHDGGNFSLQLQVPPEVVADASLWDRAVDGVLEVNTPWIVLTGGGSFAELEGDGMFGWTALEAGKGPDAGGGVFNVFEGDVRASS